MSRVVPGPSRAYDLMPGATAAQFNALITARSYERSPPIRLGPGLFELEEQLELSSYVRIIGAGRDQTRLAADWAPNVDQADVYTNALILAEAPITGTVNTTLASRSKIGATSSTLTSGTGVAIGQWLAITSVNLTDEATCSDGAGNDTVQLVYVTNVAGAVITHAPLAKHAISGSTVQTCTPYESIGISDLTLYAAGGTIANGFTALRCLDVEVSRVAVQGFSRTGIEFGRGTQRGVVSAPHSLGEVNSIVRLDAADDCSVRGTTCDPNGARYHANGIPRGLITVANDCSQPKMGDNHLSRGCIAYWDRKSHNSLVDVLHVRDCVPDEAATRLATAGEYDSGALIGVVMTSSGKLSNSANVIAPTWRNVKIADCSSALAVNVASALFVHDVRDANIDVAIENRGGITLAGNLIGASCRDSKGALRLTSRGYSVGLYLTGSFVCDIERYLYSAESGSTGETTGANWPILCLIQTPVVANNLELQSVSGFASVRGASLPAAESLPARQEFRNLSCYSNFFASFAIVAVNNCGGGAGAQGCIQGVVVAIDRTGTEQQSGYTQFTDATGAADEQIAVVVGGSYDYPLASQSGATPMLIAPICGEQSRVFAYVRTADTVRPGDILIVDPTSLVGGFGTRGQFLMVDNTPAAGVPRCIAVGRKTSVAAPILVEVRAP